MATVDMAKKKRTVLRSCATKVINELKDTTLTPEKTKVKIDSLRKVQRELDTLNEVIFDGMLEMNETEDKCTNEVERSRLVTEEICSILNAFTTDNDEIHKGDDVDGFSTACSTNSQVGNRYKLPKIRLEQYDVSPANWVTFWAQFEPIHNDKSLSNTEKFSYLRMTLLGASKALLETYPLTDDNYEQAVKHLTERFGRKELIVNAAYKELIALVRSHPTLDKLFDTVSAKIRCLTTYGLSVDQVAILEPLIVDCLPIESRKLWERRVRSDTTATNQDTMDALIKFLGQEAEAEERVKQTTKPLKNENRQCSTAAFVAMPSRDYSKEKNERELKCIFCMAPHANKDCTKNMSVEERRTLVKSNRCCFACLAPGHSIGNCKTRERLCCKICKGKHREMCCVKTNPQPPKEEPKKTTPGNVQSATTTSCFAGASKGSTIVLQTLLAASNHRKVRVLLDTGSHRSYASAQICKESGTAVGEETFTHMLFGGGTSGQVKHPVHEIKLTSLDGENTVIFHALQQDPICGNVPNFNTQKIVQTFLNEGISLYHDNDLERPIEVLLGADTIPKIVKGVRTVECANTRMLAFETTLGWCAMGTFENGNSQQSLLSMLTVPHLPSLWEFEPLGIENPTKSTNAGIDCIEEFKKTVKIDQDGKYHVCLPWTDGHPPIPERRQMAETRLNQVTQRLKRNDLYDEYDKVFREWEKDGIIEEVQGDTTTSHYLAHRPVIREGKTTKIRPVFDASAKGPGEASLNDCLESGPNMISDLMKLLLQFRREYVGVVADIKKAFLMIRLARDEDKNMLKFLWWRDGQWITFRHLRVVFGLTSSPFLLNATLSHHLQDAEGENMAILRKSFYVDDVVTSLKSRQLAEEFQKDATMKLAQAGFELCGWKMTGDDEMEEQLVLGLRWLPSADTIGVRKPVVPMSSCYTKKALLSLVGRIYDPLGLMACATLPIKLLLKECFKLKLPWDEPLPKEILLPVEKWLTEIDLIDTIMVPRCVKSNKDGDAQLHVFSDASMNAMGACVFLRWQDDDQVKTTLVSSKARVSPTETISIPRLELVAALLAARLGNTVCETFNIQDVTYWSDSTCTLYWIKKGEWRTFVGNRVKEIIKLTKKENWRFVDGVNNPADVVSRGCSLSEYADSKWWEGPKWLQGPPGTWPVDKLVPTTDEAQPVSLLNVPEEENDPELFTRFSKFSRAVRVVGWIKRFIHNTRQNDERLKGELTLDEVQAAENTLVRWMQSTYPSGMKECSVVERDSKGLLRVRTKLLSDTFEVSFKEPLLLPPCSLVDALVDETHRKLHHTGATTVLGLLRENYWIPTGRRIARKVISKCIRCRLYRAKPTLTPAVGLPDNRVEPGKAFEICGCDLAGPLFLSDESKVWIVLFTCAVYRAVHLEIVDSLSTEAFIMALRRMIARRGRVKEMYSDNGTNFTGAWNLIKAVEVETATKIRWIFNVPSAPWWGGFFERLIGVMKSM